MTYCNKASVTVASLLPPELLFCTLAVTHPSRHVPATCRVFATAFRATDPILKRSWHHNVIFYSLLPEECSDITQEELNYSYPMAQQLQSRLSFFLKSRLRPADNDHHHVRGCPGCGCVRGASAGDLAPEKPLRDVFINQPLVDFLFSPSHGPFTRQSTGVDAVQLRKTLESFWITANHHVVEHTPFEDGFATIHCVQYTLGTLNHRHWLLVPDAIQLAIFFLRSGNPTIFRHTLGHLHRVLPALATTKAPFFHWAALSLDNREPIRQVVEELQFGDMMIDQTPNEAFDNVSFTIYLATLCAFDWSVPCLEAVFQVFNVDPKDFAAWIQPRSQITDAMLRVLGDISNADRVLHMVKWLKKHGVTLHDAFPLAMRTDDWPVFARLFQEHDQAMVDQPEFEDIKLDLGADMARLLSEFRLSGKGKPEDWEQATGIVHFAFEHDMLEARAIGVLLSEALSVSVHHPASRWEKLVAQNVQEREWIHVLHHAVMQSLESFDPCSIHDDRDDSSTSHVLTRLLNRLSTDHGMSPMVYFSQHCSQWSWSYVYPLFNTSPRDGWDFVGCACALVDLVSSSPDSLCSAMVVHRISVLSHLLDYAILNDALAAMDHLSGLPPKQLAIMIIAVAKYMLVGVDAHADASETMVRDRAPLPATRALLIRVWKQVLQGGDYWGYVGRRPLLTFVPKCLEEGMRTMVCDAVAEAQVAEITPTGDRPTALTQRIALGATNMGQALAFLIEFDPSFVLRHIEWDRGTPLWLWHKFSPDLVQPRVRKPKAVACCLMLAAWAGQRADVRAILHRVPDVWWTDSRQCQWVSALQLANEDQPTLQLERIIAKECPEWLKAWVAKDEDSGSCDSEGEHHSKGEDDLMSDEY